MFEHVMDLGRIFAIFRATPSNAGKLQRRTRALGWARSSSRVDQPSRAYAYIIIISPARAAQCVLCACACVDCARARSADSRSTRVRARGGRSLAARARMSEARAGD